MKKLLNKILSLFRKEEHKMIPTMEKFRDDIIDSVIKSKSDNRILFKSDKVVFRKFDKLEINERPFDEEEPY
jgi:hypothetical protein